jgi:hypothetical protein
MNETELLKSVLLSVKILFFCANFLPALAGDVAQICNLLYRRIAFGWVPCAAGSSGLAMAGGWQIRDPAECHSALLRLRLRRAGFIRVHPWFMIAPPDSNGRI